eukprot:SAG11_NODE_29721_length_308_cov_0.492823_1_plen_32_part_01
MHTKFSTKFSKLVDLSIRVGEPREPLGRVAST